MNYGQVKDAVLVLLNQYSIAGSYTAADYNNQQDYINRIPYLVNDAQRYIASAAKHIPEVVSLSELPKDVVGENTIYTMPKNFMSFRGTDILDIGDKHLPRTPFLRVLGYNRFVIPSCDEGGKVVEYNRYPRELCADPADSEELDNTPDAQDVVPFYVASYLVMGDDAYQHAALHNDFETKLARLNDPVVIEPTRVADAYNWGGAYV